MRQIHRDLLVWLFIFAVTTTIALMCNGCCSTPETIIRTDTLTVYQQGSTDTLTMFRTDTVWSAENQKYIVRVDTLIKKVTVWRKPDTVRVAYRDTVTIYKESEGDFFDGVTLKGLMIFIGVIVFTVFIGNMFKK